MHRLGWKTLWRFGSVEEKGFGKQLPCQAFCERDLKTNQERWQKKTGIRTQLPSPARLFLEPCFEDSGLRSVIFVYWKAQACMGCMVTLHIFTTLLIFLLSGVPARCPCLPMVYSYWSQLGWQSFWETLSSLPGKSRQKHLPHNSSFPFTMATAFLLLDSCLDFALIYKLCPKGKLFQQ